MSPEFAALRHLSHTQKNRYLHTHTNPTIYSTPTFAVCRAACMCMSSLSHILLHIVSVWSTYIGHTIQQHQQQARKTKAKKKREKTSRAVRNCYLLLLLLCIYVRCCYCTGDTSSHSLSFDV